MKSAYYHRHVHPYVFQSPPSVRIAYTSPSFFEGIFIKSDIGQSYENLSIKLKFVSKSDKTLGNLTEDLSA